MVNEKKSKCKLTRQIKIKIQCLTRKKSINTINTVFRSEIKLKYNVSSRKINYKCK